MSLFFNIISHTKKRCSNIYTALKQWLSVEARLKVFFSWRGRLVNIATSLFLLHNNSTWNKHIWLEEEKKNTAKTTICTELIHIYLKEKFLSRISFNCWVNCLPAQDRVFHIFSKRIIIAIKCDTSPARRKMFIFYYCCVSTTEVKIILYTTPQVCREDSLDWSNKPKF